jgi:hypothetical protein
MCYSLCFLFLFCRLSCFSWFLYELAGTILDTLIHWLCVYKNYNCFLIFVKFCVVGQHWRVHWGKFYWKFGRDFNQVTCILIIVFASGFLFCQDIHTWITFFFFVLFIYSCSYAMNIGFVLVRRYENIDCF